MSLCLARMCKCESRIPFDRVRRTPGLTRRVLRDDGHWRGPLADPRGVLGGSNRSVLVAPRERFSALPERTRQVLARIALDLDAVTDMDWAVNVGGQTPTDAARAWMRAHHARVRTWLHV